MYEGKILKTSNGIEVCLFPMEHLNVSQGPGFLADGSIDYSSYSHKESWAIDNLGEQGDIKDAYGNITEQKISDVYAPVTLKLVKKYESNMGSIYAHTCIFQSTQKVKLAGYDTIDYIDVVLEHCDNIDFLIEGNVYPQGSLIYREGNYGPSTASHLHIEARKRGNNTAPENDISFQMGYYRNSDVWGLKNNEPLQKIFYLDDTNILLDVPYTITGVPSWNTYVLDPTDKEDGWHTYNGETYYVVNEECLTGKHTLLEPGGPDTAIYIFDEDGKMLKDGIVTFESNNYYLYSNGQARVAEWFLYPSNTDNYYYAQANGILAKNQWVAAGSDWYYLGDDCIMARDCWVDGNDYYVDEDGIMLKGWHLLEYPGFTGTNYFYLNDPSDCNVSGFAAGQKVTDNWIASGADWYFVLSDGEMAYSCQIRTSDGKYYGFDSSGKCVNNSGSATRLNETTYPLVKDYTI